MMRLTKKDLQKTLFYMRANISVELEKELLETYGNPVEDEDGHVYEFTEQDIYEQVRKIIRDSQM